MKCSKHSMLFENRIEQENLIDAQELANCLSLSIWTIRKWRAENTIPFIKLGRAVRYNLKEVIACLHNAGGK